MKLSFLLLPLKLEVLFALLRSSDTFASMPLITNGNSNKCARFVTDYSLLSSFSFKYSFSLLTNPNSTRMAATSDFKIVKAFT